MEIFCTPEMLYAIKKDFERSISNSKIFIYQTISQCTKKIKQRESNKHIGVLIEKIHKAHRNYRTNLAQMRQLYYLLLVVKQLEQYVKYFSICNSNKYERHQKLIPIGAAPIEREKNSIQIFFRTNVKISDVYRFLLKI